MAIPRAEPGLVVRYDYLWADEAAAGRDYGKERPTCLVAASDDGSDPLFVVLLPITHSPPVGSTVGIEIPAQVKRALRMDSERSWVIVSEYNIDTWPNAGLSPIPGGAGAFSYGFVPPSLFAQIKALFLELVDKRSSRGTRR